eukprot:1184853-Prorocentrum_minimum.AAC.3
MGDSWEDLEDEDIPKFEFELPPPPPPVTQQPPSRKAPPASTPASTTGNTNSNSSPASDKPMILVDLTVLSDGAIHNKFDKNACNDPDAKRELTRKVRPPPSPVGGVPNWRVCRRDRKLVAGTRWHCLFGRWETLCSLDRIEKEYSKYANDSNLVAQGVVRPCGQCVWRDALASLRDEVPGHFFAPIFPP